MPSIKAPRLLALFQKRINGDDALLELARRRFQEAGLGAEYYAASPEELHWLLGFQPGPDTPVMLHLPREIDLFDKEGRRKLLSFAGEFKDRIYGFVVHDHLEIRGRLAEYNAVLNEVNYALQAVKGSPFLFIEYAAGLTPEFFCELIEGIRDLSKVSACLDIGHLGIRQARDAFRRKHPAEDICALEPSDVRLPKLVDDVQAAVETSLPMVLQLNRRLGGLGKPLHFHLHDGHPLATASAFGVSDHLSFFEEISTPFAHHGKRSLAPMFGPSGIRKIVAGICAILDSDHISFTLEIHPTGGRLPLSDASPLFNHWLDKTNAEQMNHWLAVLLENHRLLQRIVMSRP
jgi:hypothetical protein